MSIKLQLAGDKTNLWGGTEDKPRSYEIVPGTNDWGKQLNGNMRDIDERLVGLEASRPHPTAGIIASGVTAAAIAVSASKPVSRRSMFNAFRRTP